MKKKTAFVLAIAVAVLSCASYSNATLLGTIESNRAGSDLLGEFPEMYFSISYSLPLPVEPGPFKTGWDSSISLSWNITSEDVGQTFFASADTQENFDAFAFHLTNGINNSLILTDSTISAFPTYAESDLISGIQDGVDFEGYKIDSLALTVNELFLNYNGFRTNYSYDITYTIYGAPIPEPGTVFLLGVGCLVFRRWNGSWNEWRLLKGFWAINPLFRLAKLLGFKIIVLSGIDA
jgi:hypothetical protein